MAVAPHSPTSGSKIVAESVAMLFSSAKVHHVCVSTVACHNNVQQQEYEVREQRLCAGHDRQSNLRVHLLQKEIQERDDRIARLYAADAILEDPFATVSMYELILLTCREKFLHRSPRQGVPQTHAEKSWGISVILLADVIHSGSNLFGAFVNRAGRECNSIGRMF